MNAAYLRKSRADMELEKNSGIDTLQRHRDIIKRTADYMNIKIDKWYEESGHLRLTYKKASLRAISIVRFLFIL